MSYTPIGVCSKQINIEVDDNNIVQDVEFIGGCNGNLKGIGALVKGMTVEEVIEKLENITCGYKSTSCPDQLAKALKESF
ncbi:MAG: TIGR03905 family TSCPD domain-containing protein [Ruminococcus sp.]|nr:TIGR03905 family TSCPD domain-containing protein [Ruminococcus sp.]